MVCYGIFWSDQLMAWPYANPSDATTFPNTESLSIIGSCCEQDHLHVNTDCDHLSRILIIWWGTFSTLFKPQFCRLSGHLTCGLILTRCIFNIIRSIRRDLLLAPQCPSWRDLTDPLKREMCQICFRFRSPLWCISVFGAVWPYLAFGCGRLNYWTVTEVSEN